MVKVSYFRESQIYRIYSVFWTELFITVTDIQAVMTQQQIAGWWRIPSPKIRNLWILSINLSSNYSIRTTAQSFF